MCLSFAHRREYGDSSWGSDGHAAGVDSRWEAPASWAPKRRENSWQPDSWAPVEKVRRCRSLCGDQGRGCDRYPQLQLQCASAD